MKKNIERIVVFCMRSLLGRPRLVRIARMLTRGARLDGENRINNNGERLVIQVALKHASQSGENTVVIDCGANIGDYTAEVARQATDLNVTHLSIHAFEPASVTFRSLEESAGKISSQISVIVNQMALSDSPGNLKLHVVHEKAGVNSLVQTDISPVAYSETVSVNTLDAYCESREIENVLLLKIDTEGNDFNVLAGANKMMNQGRIELVQFEYNYRWIYARKYLRDVFELIKGKEFCLGKVTNSGIEFYRDWHPELETFAEGNYLICSHAWRARFPNIEWWGYSVLNKIPKSSAI